MLRAVFLHASLQDQLCNHAGCRLQPLEQPHELVLAPVGRPHIRQVARPIVWLAGGAVGVAGPLRELLGPPGQASDVGVENALVSAWCHRAAGAKGSAARGPHDWRIVQSRQRLPTRLLPATSLPPISSSFDSGSLSQFSTVRRERMSVRSIGRLPTYTNQRSYRLSRRKLGKEMIPQSARRRGASSPPPGRLCRWPTLSGRCPQRPSTAQVEMTKGPASGRRQPLQPVPTRLARCLALRA